MSSRLRAKEDIMVIEEMERDVYELMRELKIEKPVDLRDIRKDREREAKG